MKITCGQRHGSGFFLDLGGARPCLCTAAHVVAGHRGCSVWYGEEPYYAEVIELYRDMDVAVLEFFGPEPHATEILQLRDGQVPDVAIPAFVRSWGGRAPAEWRVAAVRQGGMLVWKPQPDHGASGGPVTDDEGRLLAVVSHRQFGFGWGPGWWWLRERLMGERSACQAALFTHAGLAGVV